jgi:hypothetical protein
MSQSGILNSKFEIQGSSDTKVKKGQIYNPSLLFASSFDIDVTLPESDGVKVYVSPSSPMGASADYVHIEVSSGSLDWRCVASDAWKPLTAGLLLAGCLIDHFSVRATPGIEEEPGTATFKLIVGKLA